MSMEPSMELDSITAHEFKDRLVKLCVHSGNSGLPRKQRDRHILLKSVALTLERTAEYTETEVNDRLQWWLNEVGRSIELDHVRLRRHLVDAEYLGRSKDGSRYWVADLSRNQYLFESDVEELDVHELVRETCRRT